MDYQKKNYNVNYGLLLRYLISGIAGGTTQIATLYIWVSVLGMQTYYLWGVALGFCLAAIVGFFLQKYWTFAHRNQQHLPHWQFALYVLIALGGLCLNTLTLYIGKRILEQAGIDFFHFWYLIVQVAAIALVSVLSFLVNYFITFRSI
jgi:putative flippase GtrA